MNYKKNDESLDELVSLLKMNTKSKLIDFFFQMY